MPTNSAETPLTQLIRQSELIPAVIPISNTTLWRWIKNNQFPKPLKLGSNIVAWKRCDVDDWIASRTTTAEVV